ncbi:MAG: hypothetical protein LBS74_01320, partial [Oscillospiraceae bacterium]|nr:hypothetical protein [Oscillospiraceae bacterium]
MSIGIWLIITVVIFLIGLTVVLACIKGQKGQAAIILGIIVVFLETALQLLTWLIPSPMSIESSTASERYLSTLSTATETASKASVANEIYFQDSATEEYVRSVVGNFNAPITGEDMLKVTKISHSGSDLKNFDFLKYCRNLESFTVSNSDLRSLDALENLSSLRSVTIKDCYNLEDVSALGTMPQLEYLYIENNTNSGAKVNFVLPNLSGLNEITVITKGSCDISSFSGGSKLKSFTCTWASLKGFQKLNLHAGLTKLHI